MGALDELGIEVTILARPVELPDVVPFAEDEIHHAYDAGAAHRFWLALVQSHRVLARFRGGFVGKAQPGALLLGCGRPGRGPRFSGRPAPKHPGGVPNCADWVQELAYSHEVSSCGFWPGGDGEGMFYSYAYPEPAGFADWPVTPEAAYYDTDLGEFVLPYADVRRAPDPEAELLSFFQSTYEAAAELAHWDRHTLKVGPDGPARGHVGKH